MKNAVIVIPFDLPWGWQADFMKQTAKILANDNYVFCFLAAEPVHFKEILSGEIRHSFTTIIRDYLWIFRPIYIIPLERFKKVRDFNNQLSLLLFKLFIALYLGKRTISSRILWIFDRKFSDILPVFKGFKTLYDCVDYVWDPDVQTCAYIQSQEKILIKSCDIVTVNSRILYEIHKKQRQDIHVVPQGFRLNDFEKYNHNDTGIKLPHDKPLIAQSG